jgi:hypothetical protein
VGWVVRTLWNVDCGVTETRDLKCDGCCGDIVDASGFVNWTTNGALGEYVSIGGFGFEMGLVVWWV